ncbi:hypothetical protein SEA_LYMARA_8 [Arthrobacter phage Lymara]|uniref:Uncharacterized protein n=1 Tax=Arthrobacter phage Lymara TaxID=2599828 RepID=A0A5J6TVH5_9CAUD|nr:hypothetical protein HYQ01_gp008 [Arthrobacter phage Lymara]QFG14810.1 hypothetical protein SEA_LYMARA_8 [Arthrobacter phage Lymara]
MPVRRDSNGRFAGGSGGSSKRASKASKRMGAAKPVTHNDRMRANLTPTKATGKGRVGQTASKTVRAAGVANKAKATKYNRQDRDVAGAKAFNMTKAPGLAGQKAKKNSLTRNTDKIKGGLKRAAAVNAQMGEKAEMVKAIAGVRKDKRKKYGKR